MCYKCKQEISNKKALSKEEKQIDLPENIPNVFKEKLKRVCQFKEILLANMNRFGESRMTNKNLDLNRFETFLLKIIIPFIRVGHCPQGRYLQVRGNVILISADLPHSIEKILPQEQDLFPVSFKRKMVYEGHFIEEIIDKNKVIAWFNWFKSNNPHFQGIELQSERIDEFTQTCRKAADDFERSCQVMITEPDDEIDKEEMEEIPLSNE